MTPSARIETIRRRVTARMMRGVFRTGAATGARLPRVGIHRILVCRNVHTLGDSLTLTPLLTELGHVYPGAEVDIVSGCPVAEALYGAFPNVRHIHRLPRHVVGHLLATGITLHEVRRKRYDLVIDPDPQSQSGRLLALGAHARYSLGYIGPGKSGTLTHGVAVPPNFRHKARMPVYLLRRALGEDPGARGYPRPALGLTRAELSRGRRCLARLLNASGQARAGAPGIAVFANATRDKRLASAWWQAFIEAFRQQVPEGRIVEILPASGTSMLGDRFACFYSSDVRRLAAVIANMDAYISADCGVMHLAWASGTPTVGLFRVTDPGEWGPFGPHAASLQTCGASPAELARACVKRLGLGRGPDTVDHHGGSAAAAHGCLSPATSP